MSIRNQEQEVLGNDKRRAGRSSALGSARCGVALPGVPAGLSPVSTRRNLQLRLPGHSPENENDPHQLVQLRWSPTSTTPWTWASVRIR